MILPEIQTADSFNHRFGHCCHAEGFLRLLGLAKGESEGSADNDAYDRCF
jgi:hypothetical protein